MRHVQRLQAAFHVLRRGVSSFRSNGECMSDLNKYYGIYRGTMVINVDPMQLGRIQATVRDAGELAPSTWAMPSVPIGISDLAGLAGVIVLKSASGATIPLSTTARSIYREREGHLHYPGRLLSYA
jgi:hypothetical protein